MARKYIIPKKEVLARRALEWEYHYGNRRKVMEVFGIYDPLRVINTITREIPSPIMRADGSLLEGIATVRGRSKAAYYLNIDQMQKDLLCLWYWSEDGWANLNAQFQNLPDVTEDYCLLYDPEIDAAHIVPKSVQVRYKSGTSQAVVPQKHAQEVEA
ncbi:MAG: hypothetical protein IPP74_15900 [Alphaproteobacteria bacterium]|nr:hypothetical protein [Alphaproteobacteria bacterium]